MSTPDMFEVVQLMMKKLWLGHWGLQQGNQYLREQKAARNQDPYVLIAAFLSPH